MAWEWQAWGCFDSIRETFVKKSWKSRFVGSEDNGARPVLAASGAHRVVFFERDSYTGECWFEVRDKARGRLILVHRERNIPTPEQAARLLANHDGPIVKTAASDRPIYNLPVATVAH